MACNLPNKKADRLVDPIHFAKTNFVTGHFLFLREFVRKLSLWHCLGGEETCLIILSLTFMEFWGSQGTPQASRCLCSFWIGSGIVSTWSSASIAGALSRQNDQALSPVSGCTICPWMVNTSSLFFEHSHTNLDNSTRAKACTFYLPKQRACRSGGLTGH